MFNLSLRRGKKRADTVNTQIASFSTVVPIVELTIEEQLKVWRDNTPVWNSFPVAGESAVYILGWPGRFDSECQPIGAIVVFNGKRGTARAYPNTVRNAKRITRLGFAKYGYVRNRVGAFQAYTNVVPTGLSIPDHNAILNTARGIVLWDKGIVAYYRDSGKGATELEGQWYSRVYDALRGCKLTSQIWGYAASLNFCPSLEKVEWMEASAPMVQPLILTGSQVLMLDDQLIYWRDRVDVCFEGGDLDGAEFASLYAVAIEGLIGLL